MESATRTWPRSLEVLGPRLRNWSPPTAIHDPRGAWTHRYALLSIVPEPGGQVIGVNRPGTLTIRREPRGESAVLRVSELLAAGNTSLHTSAEIDCAGDALASPRDWTVTTRILDPRGRPLPETTFTRTGQRVGERFESSSWPRPLPAGPRTTCFWSLFAALGERAAEDREPWAFDLLDELDQLKPAQSLRWRHALEVPTAGGAVALAGYEQFGTGSLPTAWWRDGSGRVVAVIAFLRGYLLESAENER